MPWVRVDDQFPDHPKVVSAGPLAKALFIDALCYANRLLTDGFVPSRIALRLASEYSEYVDPNDLVTKLVDVGLLEDRDDGFAIHDYLEYQMSAERVKSERNANADRQARWRDRNRNEQGQFENNGVTTGVSNAVSNAPRNGIVTPAPIPTQPRKKKESDDSFLAAKRSSRAPESLPLEEHHYAWAEKSGFSREQCDAERDAMIDWHASKGTRFVDWYGAWRSWMRKATPKGGKAAPIPWNSPKRRQAVIG